MSLNFDLTESHEGGCVMAKWTTDHPRVGERIEIPPYYGPWMQGARFGTIEKYIDRTNRFGPRFAVRMDHPQVKQLVEVFADEV